MQTMRIENLPRVPAAPGETCVSEASGPECGGGDSPFAKMVHRLREEGTESDQGEPTGGGPAREYVLNAGRMTPAAPPRRPCGGDEGFAGTSESAAPAAETGVPETETAGPVGPPDGPEEPVDAAAGDARLLATVVPVPAPVPAEEHYPVHCAAPFLIEEHLPVPCAEPGASGAAGADSDSVVIPCPEETDLRTAEGPPVRLSPGLPPAAAVPAGEPFAVPVTDGDRIPSPESGVRFDGGTGPMGRNIGRRMTEQWPAPVGGDDPAHVAAASARPFEHENRQPAVLSGNSQPRTIDGDAVLMAELNSPARPAAVRRDRMATAGEGEPSGTGATRTSRGGPVQNGLPAEAAGGVARAGQSPEGFREIAAMGRTPIEPVAPTANPVDLRVSRVDGQDRSVTRALRQRADRKVDVATGSAGDVKSILGAVEGTPAATLSNAARALDRDLPRREAAGVSARPRTGTAASGFLLEGAPRSAGAIETQGSPRVSGSTSTDEAVLQLADRIRIQVLSDEGEIRIQLRPESLGQVEIRAGKGQSGVVAHIIAESASVRDYLEGRLLALERALQDQGLHVERIEVSAQDGSHSQAGSFDFMRGQGGGRGGHPQGTSAGSSRARLGSDEAIADAAAAVTSVGPNSTFHTVA